MSRFYFCATPIGNLEDITLRVLRILGEVSFIACEDTRHSAKLLTHYEIQKPLIPYHEHNRRAAMTKILNALEAGDGAYITDAGLPSVSDPGRELLQILREAGHEVTVLPGASASLTALVLSGLPMDHFVFEGFLPRKGRERRERLELLAKEPRTAVLYEAPHRLTQTLRDLAEHCGERSLALCRELTKQYEEVRDGLASEHLAYYENEPPRGEFVLILAGARSDAPDLASALAHARALVQDGMGTKAAAKTAAEAYPGIRVRALYQALIDEPE